MDPPHGAPTAWQHLRSDRRGPLGGGARRRAGKIGRTAVVATLRSHSMFRVGGVVHRMVGGGVLMLGSTPTMLGTTPTMLGTAPTMLGTTPTMLGTAPTMLGTAATMLSTTPPC